MQLGAPEDYAECVRLSRLGWCALSLGTARAVLDYVIPYVNERTAFGEPISHRQSVAFMVANIGIELEGIDWSRYRRRIACRAGLPFAREVALARKLATDKGMQIGTRRRPAARRPRLHQGAPGGTVVPRPASHRREEGACCLMDQPRDTQEVPCLRRPGTPGRGRDLPADLAQVRPGRTRVPRRTRHHGGDGRRPIGSRAPGRAPAPPASTSSRRGRRSRERRQHVRGAALETSWGDVGLMLSIPYQGLGNAAIAAVATDEQLESFGKVWASMAITEPGFGSDSASGHHHRSCSTATSGCSTARRSS